MVGLFYDRVPADPESAGYLEGRDMDRLKRHQRLFAGQALGSGKPYPGQAMKRAHEGLASTGEAFDRVVGHLGDAPAEAGVDAPAIGTIAETPVPLKPDIVTG